MLNNRTDKIRLLICLIAGTFILLFVGLITISKALAQWPNYRESFFNPTFSFFNSPYTNSFASSSFPSIGFRGSESYGNYGNGGIYNSYTYGNFGTFSPSIFSSFPGTTMRGLYGGPNGGLYAGLTNYNTFSPGIYSSEMPNTYITPLSLGPWTNPSPRQGLTITPNNSWPGAPNIWATPFPGGSYPYPYPYPSPKSGLTIIKTNTDGLLEERIRDALGLDDDEPITKEKALTLTSLNAKDMCFEQLLQ